MSDQTSERILFAWSGGKDSAMALHELRSKPGYEIVALLTTVTETYDRISMHGVRRVLLEDQARSLGLPLKIVTITEQASNEEYESKMQEALVYFQRSGVSSVAFGDIFLEDLRKYREEKLNLLGLKGVFPIWKRDTRALARCFIDLGFKAVITCIDVQVLDKSFSGRVFDRQFLTDLPPKVDPCGENGEFHSFVFDGPGFSKRIAFEKGERVLRNDRFYYCDLVPLTTGIAPSELEFNLERKSRVGHRNVC